MSIEIRKAVQAAYIFFLKEENSQIFVLLGKRQNTGYMDGMLMCPAGHVMLGEPPSRAAVRESLEEIGVHVLPEDLEFAHIMSRPANNDAGDRVDYFFLCRVWSGEIVNNEAEKCESLDWYNIKALPDEIVPYIKSALSSIFNSPRSNFSELGWSK